MIFKTPYNRRELNLSPVQAAQGEIYTQVSMTIPDQTLTIPQMLERHARGLTFDQMVPIYQEVDVFQGVNPKTLDLSEIEEMRDQTIERLKEAKLKARKEQDDKQAAARKAAIDEAVKQHLAASGSQKNSGDQPE